MKKLRQYTDEMGIVGLTVVMAVALTLAFSAYFGAPEAVEVGSDLASKDPGPPALVEHHAERGEGMEDGPTVGAASFFPRPEALFEAHGIDYEYAQTPNISQRGAFAEIEGIVLHITGAGTMDGMKSWFSRRASGASAHFGVGKDGSIDQYAEVADATWHAGRYNSPNLDNPMIAGWWNMGPDLGNPNRRTVGIEVLLDTDEKLSSYPKQQESLYLLMNWLHEITDVPLDNVHVIGHNEVDNLNRRLDPIASYTVDEVLDALEDDTPSGSGCAPTPCWDGVQWQFGDGLSWRTEPAPYGEWVKDGSVIWDLCDPRWGGRRSPADDGIWVAVGTWVFFEDLGYWSAAPTCT